MLVKRFKTAPPQKKRKELNFANRPIPPVLLSSPDLLHVTNRRFKICINIAIKHKRILNYLGLKRLSVLTEEW